MDWQLLRHYHEWMQMTLYEKMLISFRKENVTIHYLKWVSKVKYHWLLNWFLLYALKYTIADITIISKMKQTKTTYGCWLSLSSTLFLSFLFLLYTNPARTTFVATKRITIFLMEILWEPRFNWLTIAGSLFTFAVFFEAITLSTLSPKWRIGRKEDCTRANLFVISSASRNTIVYGIWNSFVINRIVKCGKIHIVLVVSHQSYVLSVHSSVISINLLLSFEYLFLLWGFSFLIVANTIVISC